MVDQYLVTIEFRYNQIAKTTRGNYRSKIVTIGVYNDFEDACKHGNEVLEVMETKFKKFPSASESTTRFSKNGGCFGMKNDLVGNLGYLNTPFTFFAKITRLEYNPLEDIIDDVTKTAKQYLRFKK